VKDFLDEKMMEKNGDFSFQKVPATGTEQQLSILGPGAVVVVGPEEVYGLESKHSCCRNQEQTWP